MNLFRKKVPNGGVYVQNVQSTLGHDDDDGGGIGNGTQNQPHVFLFW
jgi:hypothetical protein